VLTSALAIAALVVVLAVRHYPYDVSAAIAATDHDQQPAEGPHGPVRPRTSQVQRSGPHAERIRTHAEEAAQ
jgi:hypothetical protein